MDHHPEESLRLGLVQPGESSVRERERERATWTPQTSDSRSSPFLSHIKNVCGEHKDRPDPFYDRLVPSLLSSL